MKKVGDIMKALGFQKGSPESTQQAFIKHLVSAAERQVTLGALHNTLSTDLARVEAQCETKSYSEKTELEVESKTTQLCFNFEDQPKSSQNQSISGRKRPRVS